MKIFFDTSISHRIADAVSVLREDLFTGSSAKIRIEHHRARFKQDADDYDWLNTLTLEGSWVVVSADNRILTHPLYRKVLEQKNLIFFVLEKGWKGLDLWGRAWRVIKVWPDVIQQARRAKPGDTYKVSVNCKIKKLV